MFNKKGQEGITLGTLLLIILGVVVVVVIIIGATSGFDFVFSKFKLAPGQSLEAKTQACIVAAKTNLNADFCREFDEVEIAGANQYVSCNFDSIKSAVAKAEGVTKTPDCDPTIEMNDQIVFCENLNKEGKVSNSVNINSFECKKA
ncbi:hypothetical protein COU54_04550 [Candidatus Pacearchaeota archaeon CG10_big_fil_rev_8_21_14_0_10_31_24]|nr:MAG: hypothetical protein COU54_04550 [Candidatus Pacearchaeota archaeon CG10_big_fil_rev_8_21_14_0_10_31_24]